MAVRVRVLTVVFLDRLDSCCYASRMAKQRVAGAPAYNNLEGWMRDVTRLRESGGEAFDNFLDLFGALVDECEAVLDQDGGDDATDGDTLPMDGSGYPLRPTGDVGPGGPTPRSEARGTAASLLDRALDSLAGEERSQAQRELDFLRMHSMGAPRVAVAKENPNRGTRK